MRASSNLRHSLLLAGAMATVVFGLSPPPLDVCVGSASLGPLTGDANADGSVNILDVMMIILHIIGGIVLDDCQFASADLNSNMVLNLLDAQGTLL